MNNEAEKLLKELLKAMKKNCQDCNPDEWRRCDMDNCPFYPFLKYINQ
jgi:hypothetical protein